MSTDATIAQDYSHPGRGRHVMLPALLFAATCLSTFWTGAASWKPIAHLGSLENAIAGFFENLPQGSPMAALRQAAAVSQLNFSQGLIYMAAVLGILLTHEMGHFLFARRSHIPASLPYFIPVPVIPFGTLGAVIGMEGSKANRREMFDMGIAGPLAGLAVTLPVTLLGIWQLPAVPAAGDTFVFHNPLLFQFLIQYLRPDYATPAAFHLSQFNPFLMAGWMGMLVTGLNMLPVSQLDGGHVAYALLGRRSHLLARTLLIAAILFVLVTEQYSWVIMIVVVTLLGADHPPTADDHCKLGRTRGVIGWLSLAIPILCFPPMGIALAQ